MNLDKKRQPLIKRRERVIELMLPYQQELEFIDAQLELIKEYEKAQAEISPELPTIAAQNLEAAKSDIPTPKFLQNAGKSAA